MPSPEIPDAATEDAVKQQESHAISDFDLPKTLVTRIAKSSLPDNIKLQKEAVGSLVMSATVFVNYLAATAQDVTFARSAKTLTAADVLKALEIIEFDDIIELMKHEHDTWKAQQEPSKSKSRAKRQTAADSASVTPSERGSTSKRADAEQEAVQESRSEIEPEEAVDELEDEPEQAEASDAEEDEHMHAPGVADQDEDEEEESQGALDTPMDVDDSGLHEELSADEDD